ncbi:MULTISPECIES: carboxymuconolactone decarboxylase family protein [unclassified Roseovarius]|uniref:carboxymuconolactone decarboxylase family protein n=1 Tax=unclassified Roseovarius TaxID=2614913 RepID=UPI00273D65A5|nr:carboxymuconolactone decarboxylase family protein [Roseovarius sp. MMSF_3350]
MTRIALPASIETAPAAAQPLLEAVKKMLGSVPNLFRITANSPAALEGYLGLNGALAKGSLDARTREGIALAVAQINGCDYCLAAHTYLATHVAKLDEAEIAANRGGGSEDEKADAAIRFATALVNARGHVSENDVSAIKAAGYSEAEIVEIVAHVALNTLTNYLNSALDTPIDFPVVNAKVA